MTNVAPAARYTQVFPSLATPPWRALANADITVPMKSASALRMAMIGHQAATIESPTGHRLMITDNFYTRHALAKAVKAFTDGETRMIGTVRENNVAASSKKAVEHSKARVSAGPRGSWELIAIPEIESGYAQRKKEHSNLQRTLSKSARTTYPAPKTVFAPHAGFIVFMDKKIVIFYTNDLCETPTKLTMQPTDPGAVECVHGLFPIKRWTGEENLHRKTFMVPAVIAAYNIGMNGVDRVDQLQQSGKLQNQHDWLCWAFRTVVSPGGCWEDSPSRVPVTMTTRLHYSID
jgi:hypothetical protein